METVNPSDMRTKPIIKRLVALMGLPVLLVSCDKAELATYDHPANLYFDLSDNGNPEVDRRDSIVYTFAYDMTKARDTVFIPVRLSGIRESRNRQYQVAVEQDSSTALAGIHYEALQPSYPLAADSGMAFLPLVIYNTADLEENAVTLILKLQPSADFGIENPSLIRAKVVVSARLEQPQWWSMWLGAYSRTKHQLFLLVTGQTELSMDGLDAPKNLYFAQMLTMMLNNPFGWVQDNPEKGYVLAPVETGSTDRYHFYHELNPGRTILLRRNAGGMYYFIDENGEEVR